MESKDCLFCDSRHIRPLTVLDGRCWFVISDNYPVGRGHALIILKRHHPDIFGLSWPEWKELQDIVEHTEKYLAEEFHPDGYNLGVNCGLVAGQTVFHLHIYLIPRYQGDLGNPIGSIRNLKKPIIPND